jgi:hypothetical protein
MAPGTHDNKDPARCAAPACRGAALVRVELESGWAATRFVCSHCGRPYTRLTTFGQLAQAAPVATAGTMLLSCLLGLFGGDDDPGL